jgi:transcriptional regulator with XRE-family HTH domain
MKLPQDDLSFKLEVTQGAISAWENGANAVAPQILAKLASELGLAPGDLVQESESVAAPKIEAERLASVLMRIDAAGRSRFQSLPADKKARLIAHVYGSDRGLIPQEISAVLALVE